LKNVRATYQRAMVILFHDMMHREIEVYVDDILANKERRRSCTSIEEVVREVTKVLIKVESCKAFIWSKNRKIVGLRNEQSRNRS